MPTSTRRSLTALSLLLTLAATACAGSSSGGDDAIAPPAREDAPKAPPVTGTPPTDEITEAFGVFVAVDGQARGAGTRESPLATIAAGIELAKRNGKRV